MATNDFLAFATGGSANVLSQSAYAALSAISNGYVSGVAQSSALNKTWRQSSIMAAVLAQFISDQTGANSTDDGTTSTLLANLKKSMPGRLLRTTVYTLVSGVQYVSVDGATPVTTGASTFTALAATGSIEIEANGGGGGGGGVPATSSSQVCLASGGSAGAYGRGRYFSGFSSLAITVGAPGVGGALGNNAGTQGGTSSAGSLMSCPGGPPGVGSGQVATGAYGTSNVPPGRANLPTGANIISMSGGVGFAGIWSGGTSTPTSGTGGNSVYGAGGNAVQGSAGAGGLGYGAGGSGAAAQPSAPGYAGGSASGGIVIIREFA